MMERSLGTPLVQCDLLVPPEHYDMFARACRVLDDELASGSLSQGSRVHHAGCMLAFGAGEVFACVIASDLGNFPVELYASALCVRMHSDAECRAAIQRGDTKDRCFSAFAAAVMFELAPFYYHLVPDIVAPLAVRPEHAGLAARLDDLVDGERPLGCLLALLTCATLGWDGAPVDDPDALARYAGLRGPAPHTDAAAASADAAGACEPPREFVNDVGALALTLARYCERAHGRVRTRTRPFIRLRQVAQPGDVLRARLFDDSAAFAARLRAVARSTAPPVFVDVAALVHERLDGFTSVAAVCAAVPLPSQLTRALVDALLRGRLAERPVLVPRQAAQAAQPPAGAADAALARFANGHWALEHIALCSGVSFERLLRAATRQAGLCAVRAWELGSDPPAGLHGDD